MSYTLRISAPRTTDFVKIVAFETLADAACDLLGKNLDKAFFVRPSNAGRDDGDTTYFAIVEIQGGGSVVARFFSGGIGRKGGVKPPRNLLERGSIAEVERDLGLEPGDLTATDWEGEESSDSAWERKMGRKAAVSA